MNATTTNPMIMQHWQYDIALLHWAQGAGRVSHLGTERGALVKFLGADSASRLILATYRRFTPALSGGLASRLRDSIARLRALRA